MNFATPGTDRSPLRIAVDETTAELLASAIRTGIVVSGDGRVSEKAAAQLLGWSHAHLKARRQEGKGPVHYVRGVDGSRISYRLHALASWIEEGREFISGR